MYKTIIAKNHNGFSLIELVISFAILAMSMLSISGLISFGHRGTQRDFREVVALQLLEERMNKILSISYKKIDSGIMGTTLKQNLTSNIFSGQPCEVKFGKVTVKHTDYTVSAILTKIPVTFSLRQLKINSNYSYNQVKTYAFTPKKYFTYNDTDITHQFPYRVIKLVMTIKWSDHKKSIVKERDLTSFIVNLD